MDVDQIVDGISNLEFERKFYVSPDVEIPQQARSLVVQAFVYVGEEYSIRIRMEGSEEYLGVVDLASRDGLPSLCSQINGAVHGLLTIKQIDDHRMGIRYEKEMSVEADACRQILTEVAERNPEHIIVKMRRSFVVEDSQRTWGWDIDTFLLDNAPLVIAECEDKKPITNLLIPSFCRTEVTSDVRFSGSFLARNPFRYWCDGWFKELEDTGPVFLDSFESNRFKEI
jgi:adenylate cyclase